MSIIHWIALLLAVSIGIALIICWYKDRNYTKYETWFPSMGDMEFLPETASDETVLNILARLEIELLISELDPKMENIEDYVRKYHERPDIYCKCGSRIDNISLTGPEVPLCPLCCQNEAERIFRLYQKTKKR